VVNLPKDQSRDLNQITSTLFPPSNQSLRQSTTGAGAGAGAGAGGSDHRVRSELTRASYLNGMASVGCDGKCFIFAEQ
jgi:hypothetical protein